MSGAAAFSSSMVGRRFSTNWCSVKPPTTRTHCGAGVRRYLVLEHAHGVCQRAHAVPAQFHVVVQAAPDDVHVAVDQPGNGPPAVQVDDLRLRAGQFHDVLARAHADEAAILDGDGIGLGVGAVKRGEFAVDKDEVWRGGCHGEELRRSRRTECGSRGNEMPAGN